VPMPRGVIIAAHRTGFIGLAKTVSDSAALAKEQAEICLGSSVWRGTVPMPRGVINPAPKKSMLKGTGPGSCGDWRRSRIDEGARQIHILEVLMRNDASTSSSTPSSISASTSASTPPSSSSSIAASTSASPGEYSQTRTMKQGIHSGIFFRT